MIHPNIDSKRRDEYNRFALCTIIGKRARQLISGSSAQADCTSKNAVSIAINELSEKKISIEGYKERLPKVAR